MLSEKPSRSIAQKAGKIDSGSDTAAMMVARMSRRNRKHDDDRERRALEQGLDRRVVVAHGEFDRVVDQLEFDVGMARLDLVDRLLHRGGDDDVAGALRAPDAERDDRLAVEPGEGPAVGDSVGDGAEIIEPDLAAGRQADHRAGEVVERVRAGERADRLVVARRFRRGRRRRRHWCRAAAG